MPYEILLTESLGRDGNEIVYVKPPESNRLSRLDSSLRRTSGVPNLVWETFKQVLLPRGYPESVSEDYAEYQLWDTVQAFCSTISHTLTTHAILVGVGVGNEEASALSAAITWIFKDGVGLTCRILFACLSGSSLDSYCKKWRLLADGMNDLAMLVELTLLPMLPDYSMQLLCVSSSMKAVVGVAGGATRAAVTQHQSLNENSGDVSAKDSSQETCVNLIASILGLLILSNISGTDFVYPLFLSVTSLHLYANYRAVKSLKFKTLNAERFHLVLCDYLKGGYVSSPENISTRESVNILSNFSDTVISGRKVKLGSSLQGLDLTSNQLRMISSVYKEKNFMLVESTHCVRVVLSRGHLEACDVFQGYFHALMLGVASSYASNALPHVLTGPDETPESPLKRFLQLLSKSTDTKYSGLLNIGQLIEVDSFCSYEFKNFYSRLASAGWSLDTHQLHSIDCGWRAAWGPLASRDLSQ